MITIYPYNELGQADFGWLKARYHFSFSAYHNPDRMGFGALRVINDDRVLAQSGFDPHPHRDMEIITFVRSGAITHKDSKGNEGKTEAGDVQVMSAGSGIRHSEFNLEDEDTTLYQIWILPNEKGVEPRWDAARFSDKKADNDLPLLVSGRVEDEGKGALFIHQDASISGGKLAKGQEITQPLHDLGYVLVSSGAVELDGVRAQQGDGAEITDLKSLKIKALEDSEVILIDVPA